ncbi:MAG: hypothetical protein IIA45_03180 [Bacteroidetes bacterium]|nr:hypothetical protein [Bacteroidota bacterium]
MKKLKYSFILFLCCILGSQAQTSISRIGIKVLPGFTDRHNPYAGAYEKKIPRFMVNAGFQYIHSLYDDGWFLETGLYYTDRGSHYVDVFLTVIPPTLNFTTPPDLYVHDYYLSLPILIRKELNNYYRSYFYVSFGPTIDYYLYTKAVWIDKKKIIKKERHSPRVLSYYLRPAIDFNLGAEFKITERAKVFLGGSLHPSSLVRALPPRYYWNWNYEIEIGMNFSL